MHAYIFVYCEYTVICVCDEIPEQKI